MKDVIKMRKKGRPLGTFSVYAFYKGDKLLGIGTKKELSEQFGIKTSTLSFYHTPANKKRELKNNRKILIKIDKF